ncbi:MAG: aldehyde ferredoxin oxidoreductase family protein [Chloroflexota bacterium]
MPNGYCGKILRVNLTEGKVDIEEQGDLFYRRYFGGMGMIAYYLLTGLAPGIDPLGPENRLIFAAGPVTGAPIGGSARNGVGAKSPLSGGFAKSEVGGFWGAELKRAGFDAIVVDGKADRPVYLWVHDGEAEIRDAAHLWGKQTRESQTAIREELGDRLVRTAQIGPAGEKMVRFACIINDLKAAAGRTGMGAVMGSKNLKAVAVRGHKPIDLAEPEKVKAMAKWMVEHFYEISPSMADYGTGVNLSGSVLMGNLPTRNFRDGAFAGADSISANAIAAQIRIKMDGCYACPIRCKKIVKVDAPWESDPEYAGPEYETLAALGSNCGVDNLKAIARGHHLCNAYGLDTISAGSTVAFAMECFENGLLTAEDTGGIDLRFGNAEAMVKVLELIADRQGIGNILAEGTRRAANAIGRGAEHFAMEVKGVDLGMHEPRVKPGIALGYAVANHGADHCTGMHDTLFEKDGRQVQEANAIGFLEPIPRHEFGPRKVALWGTTHNWRCAADSLVMCIFLPWNYQQTADILGAVTGWNTSVYEVMKSGERAATLGRVFNIREGFTPQDDRLPERYFAPAASGALKEQNRALDKLEFARARESYYRLMGWDPVTGVPTKDKVEELGVGWTAEILRTVTAR